MGSMSDDWPWRPRRPTAATVDEAATHTSVGPLDPRELRGVLLRGEVLAGRYRVGATLGRGGMGEVYAVDDLELDEEIALKLLRVELSAEAGYRERLRSEVRLARRVSHPNVCRVHDLGQHGEHLFVTMARVPGQSLRQLQRAIRAGVTSPLALPAVVDLVGQLCAALAAAHRAGVLHKDVKPDNILVDDGRVVLTDFGIASLAGELGERVVVGTPSYVAPEVVRGEACDGRADVYSAAVVAYELIAGAPPFEVRSMRDALRQAIEREAMPPLPDRAAEPGPRAALERVLAAALTTDPAERTATVGELAEGLAAALRVVDPPGDPGGTTPPVPTLKDAVTAVVARRRAEARIATVLAFHGDAVTSRDTTAPPGESTTGGGAGTEDAERIVIGLGGWPIAVGPGALTALFGAPVSLGDDAMRAVRAARALLATRPSGRAGIDTTRVMIRPGASEPVSPEVGRTAEALAASAPDGELWLSAAAARQVAAHVELAPAPDVLGARVLRVTGQRIAPPAARAMIARPRELARLEAVARACFESRTPRIVEVRGGGGSGKTHLRAAFMARVSERRDVDWLCAAAAPLGEAGPLSLLRTAAPDWYQVAGRVPGDRAGTLAVARRWIEDRAVVRPVAVMFDDVQWADEASRAVVAHLATHLEDLPVLVVVWSREPVGLPGTEVIELLPLDQATALRIAREAAPIASEDELAEVVQRAGGNPFFLEELAREVAERGGGADSTLPPTVEAAVQARLDRLSQAAAELLGAAAVVGRGFWRDAARAALPSPMADAELDVGLAELERLGLVFPAPPTGIDDDRYQFGQALVRDVAYQRLPPRDRRRAHAAVARWLAGELDATPTITGSITPTQGPAADPDLLWALAHHRELGGDLAGAAASWRIAGMRSLELFAYQQAYAALRRAWDLAGEGGGDAILAERLGEAASSAHTLEAAEAAYDSALAATPDHDAPTRARLWFRLGQVASARSDQTRALFCFERGLALVAPDGALTAAARRDPRQAALLFSHWGWVRTYQKGADDHDGMAACERAVELLDGTAHRRELAHALSRLGGAYMRAGRWGDQLRANQRNLDIALELGDLEAQITARINLGLVLGNLGDLAGAIAHTEQAVDLCRRTGARPVTGLALSNLAGYLLERGDLAAGERRLTEGIRLLEQTGQRRVLPESHQFAARLAARRGDLAGARVAIQTAIGMARAAGADADTGVGLRILAQLEAGRGDAVAAEAALTEATALLGDADAYERARLDAARARVWRQAGKASAAAAARAAAALVFERLGARLDLAALDDDRDPR